jgi:ssDNA-binding Zn-finger/Zn-ribbon topoisomerase 1
LQKNLACEKEKAENWKYKMSENRKKSINIKGNTVIINGDVAYEKSTATTDEFNRIPIEAHRTSIVRTPATPNKILSVGIIGLGANLFAAWGNLSSILSVSKDHIRPSIWENFTILAVPITMLCAFLILFGFMLKFKQRTIGLHFIGNLEVGSDRRIYLTRVIGKCPRCGSPMKMYAASQDSADHTLVCQRNPRHRLELDMTTLPEVAEEYIETRRDH